MVSNLLVRIDMSRDNFSKGQRRIANFIEEHYDEAAFMTASKLGDIVGVSESTVVRFATEIGCAFDEELAETSCAACGQCINVCPTGALHEKSEIDNVRAALADPSKTVIVGTAPAVR